MKRITIISRFLFIAFFISLFNSLNGGEKLRTKKYSTRSPKEAFIWQKELRRDLFQLLKLDDIVSSKHQFPFNPKVLSTANYKSYSKQEIEICSTPGRRIKILLTLPKSNKDAYSAVVCIHGHGGNRFSVYDKNPFTKDLHQSWQKVIM